MAPETDASREGSVMFKRWPWSMLGLLLVAGAGCLSLAQPFSPISPANAEQIKPGMTEAEVEAILGRKADCPHVGMMGAFPAGTERVALWWGFTGDNIGVYFT